MRTARIRNGTVILNRLDNSCSDLRTTRLAVPNQDMVRLCDAIEKNQLGDLDKSYHGGVCDGTQWVLRFE